MNRSISIRRWAIAAVAVSMSVALSTTASVAGASRLESPSRVRAHGTGTSILVSWARPIGASKFVVSSHPSGHSCATTKTSCLVKGLRLGGSYVFTVAAKGPSGVSRPSASSNRVRVATAGKYFLAVLNRGGALVTTYQSDYNNSSTAAKGATYLKKITAAFSTITVDLGEEAWPHDVAGAMSAFISAFHSYAKDTVSALSENSPEAYYSLQSEANDEVVNEAKVRSILSLSAEIVPPITSPVASNAIGTGETIHDFYGDAFGVTATQVVDPAAAGTGSGLPDAGYRFVAIELTIDNTSNQEVDGDANNALTVKGTDGQTYTADFGTVSACSNFSSGSGLIYLPPGDSASGCVVFELPTSVSVQDLSFSLAAGYLDTAEWTN